MVIRTVKSAINLALLVPALLALTTSLSFASTLSVPSGGDLQAAINAAQPGDTILIAAGATFVGPFTLPNKSGTASWIILRTSAPDSSLPPAGGRISPSYSSVLPHLVAPGANDPVIRTAAAAHYYRLLGLEIAPPSTTAVVSTLVKLGDGSSAQNSLSQVPHDLVLDRCYLHGLPTATLKRGVELNSASTSILNCYISDCKSTTQDSQAICGWNGPGPFDLTNNYLEGAAENVMFGGSDPWISGLIPSDITIRNNNFFKPLSWRVGDPSYAGIHWIIKNIFEIKNAQRVTIDSNVFENCWADAQTGFAISLKSANQSGTAPWSVCQDVTFTNNIVRHAGSGVNIQGESGSYPSNKVARLTLTSNLFDDISAANWGGSGYFMQITDGDSVTINHNTVIQTGNIINVYGKIVTQFTYTNNITAHNASGVKGDATAIGNATLAAYFPSCVFAKNVLEGAPQDAGLYPPGNYFPATWSDVGFVDFAGGNYTLAGTSPYKNAATDGTDIGCVFTNLPK